MYTNMIAFKILDIQYGWIFAAIETGTGQIAISNSYLQGLHVPGVFLQSIIKLLNKKEQEEWICWHGESTAYLWHFIVRNDVLELFIYDGGSSFGLPLSGNALIKYAASSDAILEANGSLSFFAQSVCDAFKFYSYGEGYDIWQKSKYKDMFPRTELSLLRKILRQNNHK